MHSSVGKLGMFLYYDSAPGLEIQDRPVKFPGRCQSGTDKIEPKHKFLGGVSLFTAFT